MANFVLMHGAFHWGGCFQKVATELLAAGHNVAMPDLASHGFDPTPPGSVADMAQYTAPARRMIEASSEKVILLGHSMGGASCNYLGEQCAEKIATLVYLAAILLPNGAVLANYAGSEHEHPVPRPNFITQGEAYLQLDLREEALLTAFFYNGCSAHDIAVAMKNLQTMQPYTLFTTPIPITEKRFGSLRRVYIECTEDRAIPIAKQRQMQKDSPGTETVTLNTGHSPFFSHPEALAGILGSLA